MPLENITLMDYGAVGISQAQGVDVCTIPTPGPGTFKIWGTVRHTLADGLRLLLGASVLMEITNGANQAQDFGPIVIDINNRTDSIIVELFVATGGADTASGNLYAQKVGNR